MITECEAQRAHDIKSPEASRRGNSVGLEAQPTRVGFVPEPHGLLDRGRPPKQFQPFERADDIKHVKEDRRRVKHWKDAKRTVATPVIGATGSRSRRQNNRKLKHGKFDSTLGYPGEGPSFYLTDSPYQGLDGPYTEADAAFADAALSDFAREAKWVETPPSSDIDTDSDTEFDADNESKEHIANGGEVRRHTPDRHVVFCEIYDQLRLNPLNPNLHDIILHTALSIMHTYQTLSDDERTDSESESDMDTDADFDSTKGYPGEGPVADLVEPTPEDADHKHDTAEVREAKERKIEAWLTASVAERLAAREILQKRVAEAAVEAAKVAVAARARAARDEELKNKPPPPPKPKNARFNGKCHKCHQGGHKQSACPMVSGASATAVADALDPKMAPAIAPPTDREEKTDKKKIPTAEELRVALEKEHNERWETCKREVSKKAVVKAITKDMDDAKDRAVLLRGSALLLSAEASNPNTPSGDDLAQYVTEKTFDGMYEAQEAELMAEWKRVTVSVPFQQYWSAKCPYEYLTLPRTFDTSPFLDPGTDLPQRADKAAWLNELRTKPSNSQVYVVPPFEKPTIPFYSVAMEEAIRYGVIVTLGYLTSHISYSSWIINPWPFIVTFLAALVESLHTCRVYCPSLPQLFNPRKAPFIFSQLLKQITYRTLLHSILSAFAISALWVSFHGYSIYNVDSTNWQESGLCEVEHITVISHNIPHAYNYNLNVITEHTKHQLKGAADYLLDALEQVIEPDPMVTPLTEYLPTYTGLKFGIPTFKFFPPRSYSRWHNTPVNIRQKLPAFNLQLFAPRTQDFLQWKLPDPRLFKGSSQCYEGKLADTQFNGSWLDIILNPTSWYYIFFDDEGYGTHSQLHTYYTSYKTCEPVKRPCRDEHYDTPHAFHITVYWLAFLLSVLLHYLHNLFMSETENYRYMLFHPTYASIVTDATCCDDYPMKKYAVQDGFKVIPADPHCKKSFGFRTFFGSSEVTPTVYNSCSHNIAVSMNGRVGKKLPLHTSQKAMKAVVEHWKKKTPPILKHFRKFVRNTWKPIPFDQWIASFPPGKRKMLLEVKADPRHGLCGRSAASSFVKKELANKSATDLSLHNICLKDPRFIQGCPPEMTLATGRYVRAAAKEFRDSMRPTTYTSEERASGKQITYTCGLNSAEIACAFDAAVSAINNTLLPGERLVYLEDDQSRFDLHLTKGPFAILALWYVMIFPRKVRRWLLRKKSVGRVHDGTRYSIPYTMQSGWPDTSYGDSVINAIMKTYIHGIGGRWYTIICGDDSITITVDTELNKLGRVSGIQQAYAAFGMEVEAKISMNIYDIEFCSSRFMPTNGGTVLVPKLGKMLSRIGSDMVDRSKTNQASWLRSIATTLRTFSTFEPLYGTLSARILQLVGDGSTIDTTNPYKIDYSRNTLVVDEISHLYYLDHHYGLSNRDVQHLHNVLSNITLGRLETDKIFNSVCLKDV